MLTLEEIYAFQKTPAAEGLTFEQCAEAVKEQKRILELLETPEFDQTAHVEALKIELGQWRGTEAHPIERKESRIEMLLEKIREFEPEFEA